MPKDKAPRPQLPQVLLLDPQWPCLKLPVLEVESLPKVLLLPKLLLLKLSPSPHKEVQHQLLPPRALQRQRHQLRPLVEASLLKVLLPHKVQQDRPSPFLLVEQPQLQPVQVPPQLELPQPVEWVSSLVVLHLHNHPRPSLRLSRAREELPQLQAVLVPPPQALQQLVDKVSSLVVLLQLRHPLPRPSLSVLLVLVLLLPLLVQWLLLVQVHKVLLKASSPLELLPKPPRG